MAIGRTICIENWLDSVDVIVFACDETCKLLNRPDHDIVLSILWKFIARTKINFHKRETLFHSILFMNYHIYIIKNYLMEKVFLLDWTFQAERFCIIFFFWIARVGACVNLHMMCRYQYRKYFIPLLMIVVLRCFHLLSPFLSSWNLALLHVYIWTAFGVVMNYAMTSIFVVWMHFGVENHSVGRIRMIILFVFVF